MWTTSYDSQTRELVITNGDMKVTITNCDEKAAEKKYWAELVANLNSMPNDEAEEKLRQWATSPPYMLF